MKKVSFIITFIFTILSSIVGAGFASGKEIATFFGSSKIWFILFVLLTAFLFFWCFYLFCKLGKKIKPSSISSLTHVVFGKGGLIVDFFFIIFSFITLSSMIAGCDTIGESIIGSNYNFCYLSIFTCLIVTIIVSIGLKFIYKVNNVIVPFMLIYIFIIILIFLFSSGEEPTGFNDGNINFFSMSLSCFLYVGLNTFTNIFLIARAGQAMTKKQVLVACVCSCIILFIMISLICCAILKGGNNLLNVDMPMIEIAYSINNVFGILYSIILWLAIFTTIVVTSFSIIEWLNNYIKNRFMCCVLVLLIGFIFSRFGFSTIVNVFYPLEGAFASILIIILTFYYFRNRSQFDN